MLGRLGTRLAVAFLKFLAVLPYGLTARLGDGLGWLLYRIPSRRKRIVHINLQLCFPDWSDARREKSPGGTSGTRSAATSSAASSGSAPRKSSKN